MNARFAAVVESLEPTFQKLLQMSPVRPERLPPSMPKRGICLFSENGRHLYVGRSNNPKNRIQTHCRASSGHGSAAFAFRLARHETGMTRASYTARGSRAELEKDLIFRPSFMQAKLRIRGMELRYVEETEATRQALLEIYAATVLETPFNDFETH